MNDNLDKIKDCLARIEALCTNPHWDSGRKNRIVELTSIAQAHLANFQKTNLAKLSEYEPREERFQRRLRDR